MRIILSLFTVFSILSTTAQTNNLVVYTQESEPFYVVLNGVRQNEKPETNVRITDLKGDHHSMRVIFDNEEFEPVDQNVSFLETNVEVRMEVVYKRDKFRVRYRGESDISQTETEKSTNQSSVNYSGEATGKNETSSTQTTKTNASRKETRTQEESSISQIQTGVEDTSKTSLKNNDKEIPADELEVNEDYRFMKNGSMCSRPSVSQEQFLDFKLAIEKENMFRRHDFVVDYFQDNCMTSEQISNIVQMDYTTIKPYEIAKIAYRHTWDTENYGLVLAALKNESDVEKLVNFLDVGEAGTDISRPVADQTRSSKQLEKHIDKVSTNSLIPGYSGGVGCESGELADIEQIKENAKEKDYTNDKMTVIRQGSQDKCFSVENIMELSKVFSHESDKLDFMEWAFHHTYDVGNFYKAFDVFTHSSSKNKFGKYVLGQPNAKYGIVVDEAAPQPPEDYNGTIGSDRPIINGEEFVKAVGSQVFQKDKMMIINFAMENYSMTTDQFIAVAEESFTSEKDILNFAKIAFPSIYDQDNFDKVKSTLSFNSSKKELENMIQDLRNKSN